MKKMSASKIILRVSVPLFLVGLILLFIPKSPFFFIKTPDKINYCDIICNKSNTSQSPEPFSVESLTISEEDIVPLLERLEEMRVQYNGQYRYISFDKGECIYYFYFMSDNSELGEITIDENGFF